MKNVLIIEYHDCFRTSLAYMLNRQSELRVIGQADSPLEDPASCEVLGETDVVVLDFCALVEDGVELIHQLREACPLVAVLALAVSFDPAYHVRALEAGAERVLTKSASLEEVIDAVMLLGSEPLAQPSTP